MTYEEIIEINKVIAEFDGWYRDLEVNKGSEINYFYKDKSAGITNDIILPTSAEHFKYHMSWDWLMPVAKKCIESYHDNRQDIYSALDKVDMPKLWIACYEFINWYNTFNYCNCSFVMIMRDADDNPRCAQCKKLVEE